MRKLALLFSIVAVLALACPVWAEEEPAPAAGGTVVVKEGGPDAVTVTVVNKEGQPGPMTVRKNPPFGKAGGVWMAGEGGADSYIQTMDKAVSLTDAQKQKMKEIFDARDKGMKDFQTQNAEKVKASREKLAAGLRRLGFAVWPSQSNFLLARPGDGEARRLYEALKQRGILVRYFQEPRLDDKLRISVGTEQDNAALIGELTKLTGPRPTSARQP